MLMTIIFPCAAAAVWTFTWSRHGGAEPDGAGHTVPLVAERPTCWAELAARLNPALLPLAGQWLASSVTHCKYA